MANEPQKPRVPEGALITDFIVRRSAFFLAIQLLSIEIVFLLLISLLLLPSFGSSTAQTGTLTVISLAGVVLLIVTVIKLGVTFLVLARWMNDFYEIHQTEIICHRGILTTHKTIFSTKDVKSMAVDQDVLGKIFRYGDIHLHNPAIEEVITLANIANPNKHMLVIKQLLPQLESQTTYIRTKDLSTS